MAQVQGWRSCNCDTVFSVSACNTLVTPLTLRCHKGQTGVQGQRVVNIRNSIIKPLLWLQGGGREKTFFEVLVRAQQFVAECGFKRFGLAHGILWLGAHIGFEWFEDLATQIIRYSKRSKTGLWEEKDLSGGLSNFSYEDFDIKDKQKI